MAGAEFHRAQAEGMIAKLNNTTYSNEYLTFARDAIVTLTHGLLANAPDSEEP